MSASPGVDAVRALAAGELAGFAGLPDGLTRADAEAALGPSDPPRELGGRFAGEPRALRHHGPAPAAPAGIDVWLDGERVVAIELSPARLAAPPAELLGEPDAVLPEPGEPVVQRLVHARRGLMLSVERGDAGRTVRRVVAFRACAPEAFAAGPLARE